MQTIVQSSSTNILRLWGNSVVGDVVGRCAASLLSSILSTRHYFGSSLSSKVSDNDNINNKTNSFYNRGLNSYSTFGSTISDHLNGTLQSIRQYSAHTNEDKNAASPVKKTTILDIRKKFTDAVPISMVTAYDYCSAKEVDRAGIDITLVGDSLGMVMLGHKGTINVTMDQMVHHCKAVMRGTSRAFVVGDMPFGSFETSPRDAVQNAIILMKEGGVDAIKLEGGKKRKETIIEIVKAGIPVMGHIGLTPQSVSSFGGFKMQGKTSSEALNIMEDALVLQETGCFAIVIEMVPDLVAENITRRISVPTIGIGAGAGTSGQVLVYHDMLGLYTDFVPKFCKQYATLSTIINEGLKNFKKEIEERKFPAQQHSLSMKEEEAKKFVQSISSDKKQQHQS